MFGFEMAVLHRCYFRAFHTLSLLQTMSGCFLVSRIAANHMLGFSTPFGDSFYLTQLGHGSLAICTASFDVDRCDIIQSGNVGFRRYRATSTERLGCGQGFLMCYVPAHSAIFFMLSGPIYFTAIDFVLAGLGIHRIDQIHNAVL